MQRKVSPHDSIFIMIGNRKAKANPTTVASALRIIGREKSSTFKDSGDFGLTDMTSRDDGWCQTGQV